MKLKQWKPVSVVLTYDELRIAYVFEAKKCCVWDCGCRSACVNPVKTHDQVKFLGKTNRQVKQITR